jgi:hypothetical protein
MVFSNDKFSQPVGVLPSISFPWHSVTTIREQYTYFEINHLQLFDVSEHKHFINDVGFTNLVDILEPRVNCSLSRSCAQSIGAAESA